MEAESRGVNCSIFPILCMSTPELGNDSLIQELQSFWGCDAKEGLFPRQWYGQVTTPSVLGQFPCIGILTIPHQVQSGSSSDGMFLAGRRFFWGCDGKQGWGPRQWYGMVTTPLVLGLFPCIGTLTIPNQVQSYSSSDGTFFWGGGCAYEVILLMEGSSG